MLPSAADSIRGRCGVQVLRTRAAVGVAEASPSSREDGSEPEQHPHRAMEKEASVYHRESKSKRSAHVRDARESE